MNKITFSDLKFEGHHKFPESYQSEYIFHNEIIVTIIGQDPYEVRLTTGAGPWGRSKLNTLEINVSNLKNLTKTQVNNIIGVVQEIEKAPYESDDGNIYELDIFKIRSL